jgi:Putative metal-binding motif
MSRTTIVFSLGLLAGCSFVDDFDKFRAGESALPGDDAGPTAPDAAVDPDAAAPDTSVPDAAADGGPGVPDAGPGPTCMPASCDDADPCTANTCNAGVCANPVLDADGDGFSPGTCKAGSSARGGDCNDNKAAIKPGASEVCDDVDNNCDGLTDEGFSKVACYPDVDLDGFANLSVAPTLACNVCAASTIAVTNPADKTQHDCYDVADPDGDKVFPGQTNFFDQGYGTGGKTDRSFDYDCSGVVETQFKPLNGTCGGLLSLLCDGSAGFTGSAIPGCGETGTYQTCGSNGLNCDGNSESRKQQCH